MDYAAWVTDVSKLTVIDSTDASFQAILPACIEYAEGRIYRELNMLNADIQDGSASCTSGSRNFILPTSTATFLILDALNVITPAATAPDSGTRNPITFVSRDYLNWTWPSATNSGVPQYAAYISQNTALAPAQPQLIFGPWPDAAYRIECCGRFTPQALSATNTTTYLTANLPDLFLAASMVFMSGYMQDFGAQGTDNPQLATSWEGQYQALRSSAEVYEARKRFGGPSWTSKAPEPMATAQRG